MLALSGDTKNTVPHPFDLCIDRSLARKNHDDKLEFRKLFPVIGEHGLDITGVINILAKAWLSKNPHSKSVRYLDQPIHEVLEEANTRISK